MKFVHKTKMVKQKPKNFIPFSVWRARNHGYHCSLNSIIWCNLPWHFSQFLSLTSSKSANAFFQKQFTEDTSTSYWKFFVRTPEFDLSPRGSNLRFSLTSARFFFWGFGFMNLEKPPIKSAQTHMGRYESNKIKFCTKLSDLCSSWNFKMDLWSSWIS